MDTVLNDPLGRRVVLADATWYGHIVSGHPEVRAYRAEVEATIERPMRIFFSSSDRDCRLYYSASPRPNLLLCVVANVAAGFVMTAYLSRRIKPGVREWP